VPIEKPIIPTFSLSERDRRWELLRNEMKKTGHEALISLPNEGHWDQFGADTRYLTQIGGFQTEVGTVFPLEGEVTAVVRGVDPAGNDLVVAMPRYHMSIEDMNDLIAYIKRLEFDRD